MYFTLGNVTISRQEISRIIIFCKTILHLSIVTIPSLATWKTIKHLTTCLNPQNYHPKVSCKSRMTMSNTRRLSTSKKHLENKRASSAALNHVIHD